MQYSTEPNDPLFVKAIDTPLSEKQLAWHLNQAWNKVFNEFCTTKQLAILWAHVSLEVGRGKYIKNNNFGNIKRLKNQKYTSYRCNEILLVDGKRKAVWFEPYHPQTLFAAWDDATSGAAHYIEFLTRPRYAKALAALKAEDIKNYVIELKVAGYFTADLGFYSKVLMKLYNEFLSKKNDLLYFKEFEEQEIDPDAVTPVVIPSIAPNKDIGLWKLDAKTSQPMSATKSTSLSLSSMDKLKQLFFYILSLLFRFISFKK